MLALACKLVLDHNRGIVSSEEDGDAETVQQVFAFEGALALEQGREAGWSARDAGPLDKGNPQLTLLRTPSMAHVCGSFFVSARPLVPQCGPFSLLSLPGSVHTRPQLQQSWAPL